MGCSDPESKLPDRLKAVLEARYNGEFSSLRAIAEFLRLFHLHEDLAGENFLTDLCSGNEEQFQQRVWEMSLSAELRSLGYTLSSASEGPDFRIDVEGDVMWIEAVSPGPGVGPDQVPTDRPRIYLPGQPEVPRPKSVTGGARLVEIPTDKILLRWTQAIASKLDKFTEYLAKGIVKPTDAMVIAVNSGQLGPHGGKGISQYPAAMEAGYPIGPRYVKFEKTSGKVVGSGISNRPKIVKLNGAAVKTTAFIEERGELVSAILSGHSTDRDLIEATQPLTVVHNFRAKIKIKDGVFGGADDYRLVYLSGEEYQVQLNGKT